MRRIERLYSVRTVLAAVCAAACASACTPSQVAIDGQPPSTVRTQSSASSSKQVTIPSLAGPWHPRIVTGAAHARPLTGDRHSLYVENGASIMRLDPATGRVLSRTRTSGIIDAEVAGGALWADPRVDRNGRVTVTGWDRRTLRTVRPIRFQVSRADARDRYAIETSDGVRIYVAVGRLVAVVDPAARRVVTRYRVAPRDARVQSIVMVRGTQRLAVTYHLGDGTNEAALFAARTGATLGRVARIDRTGGYDSALAATRGGLWINAGVGNSDIMSFHPAGHLAHGRGPLVMAGGGWFLDATAGPGVVWEGGTDLLVCADPMTGRARATAAVSNAHHTANLTQLTVAGGRLFASYLNRHDKQYLVQLHPPARCTR